MNRKTRHTQAPLHPRRSRGGRSTGSGPGSGRHAAARRERSQWVGEVQMDGFGWPDGVVSTALFGMAIALLGYHHNALLAAVSQLLN